MTDAKGCGKAIRPVAAVALAAALLGLLAPAATPSADGPPAGLGPRETVAAADAVDGATLRLADGRLLRLAAVRPPQAAFGAGEDDAAAAEALAERARARLDALAAGRRLTVYSADPAKDRYGRPVGHAVGPDGVWLQEALAAEGLVLVVPLPGTDPAAARALLRAEERARADRRGLWAEPAFRVRTPDDAAEAVDALRIVEGEVASVAEARGRIYLNFGEDWREDFTVSIAARDRDAFEAGGLDVAALEGRRIRVRGWLRDFNGPLIDASHPAQIEVLGESR
jgi:endonuclease YncB( thermonuclease family)